jgi:hypothetical protein
MSVVTTLVVAPTSVIEWARANNCKELLSILLPYEDQETLDDIWNRRFSVSDTGNCEIDYMAEGEFDHD